MIVTMAGIGGHYPPSDDDEFTAALAHLRSPIIAEEVALAEAMSQVYSYRQMANRWRHYEKWRARLDGFVAIGDSSCAFNPVYGQGMTSGALSALILGECLEKNGVNDAEMPRKFFDAQARFQAEPWGLATGADFRIPGTEGKRRLISRMLDPMLRENVPGRRRRSCDCRPYRRSNQHDETTVRIVRDVNAEAYREGVVAAADQGPAASPGICADAAAGADDGG